MLAIVSLLIVPPVGVLFITNSAMVLQATHLNLRWLGFTWLPSQVFVFNPLVSLALIPFFSAVAFPAIARLVRLTPLRKMGAGFAMTMLGLLFLVWLQTRIDAGAHPSVGWHVLVIAIFVAAELLIHITAMEYAYRIAPAGLRSVAMSFRSLTMSLGNAFVAVLTSVLNSGTGGAPGVSYYAILLIIVAIASGAFVLYAVVVREPDVAPPPVELIV